MKLHNTPEIAKLNGYMEAMSCCLDGCNYVVRFSAKGIQLEDNELESQTLDELAIRENLQEVIPGSELQSLMQLAYPRTHPHLATMCECHHGLTWLTTRVNTFIARINPSDGFKNVDKHKKQNLTIGFWRNVNACIDYQNSRFFQYNPAFGVDDELWDFIIWGFTFLIVNEQQRRCLLIHGAASD
ncbi:hypothetical protein [Microcoleus sp. PH2017_30_WIL_O_A]|uniref:hypothetical protein n=1 Tax=Microcoleus sp. PH2017_30_WIL_O_A TaxID=2798840 RepID=UPI001D596F87|nr:hypothetical protein [Microcoleus sp. PH2017_30_WIL_O_A]MCC3585005.1 hypothetical protein [Microcoleus sp. PH2017_30_WIL_O_A]